MIIAIFFSFFLFVVCFHACPKNSKEVPIFFTYVNSGVGYGPLCNKHNPSNVNTLIDTHICPIYLYDWTLNDLTSYHNKTHLIDQSIQTGGGPPCIVVCCVY